MFRNEARAKQLISFKGMSYGKIGPTDLDAFIEFEDKAYIYIEVKYNDARVPRGQRIALERLVRDTPRRKKAILLIVDHYNKDCNENVELAKCQVREFFTSNTKIWKKPSGQRSTRQMMDEFIRGVKK